MHLESKCEFSGILHRYILWSFPLKSHFQTLMELLSVAIQLHRGLAPPVMPPSITTSAPVMQLEASEARKRTAFANILHLPSPAERYPGFGHFVRINRHVASGGNR